MANERITCPHCGKESTRRVLTGINVDKEPERRAEVDSLACFRWECPNCGVTSLVVDPCLYHDMTNAFMVWLLPEGEPQDTGGFPLPSGYKLRYVRELNAFREKVNLLERGLDDCAVELMKLLLYMQLSHDLDVVELLFHAYDEQTAVFTFVAVLSDGVEQYVAMPGDTYRRLHEDVRDRLFVNERAFARIDLAWARDALELLHG